VPVYEYACRECEEHFEELVGMNADAPPCPGCGATDVLRQLSVFAVHGSSSQPSFGQTAAGGGCCGGSCGCGH
jgi:putative FmdB family regulatory protein